MSTTRPVSTGTPGTSGTARTSSAGRVRRRMDPTRKLVAIASFMVVVGSFMPWIDTAVGSISGARGPGLWTFYAAMLGLAAAIVPWRRVAGVQAAVMCAAALALPAWQLTHLVSLVGTAGWMPGPGLVVVVAGGVMAGVAAFRMLRPAAAADQAAA